MSVFFNLFNFDFSQFDTGFQDLESNHLKCVFSWGQILPPPWWHAGKELVFVNRVKYYRGGLETNFSGDYQFLKIREFFCKQLFRGVSCLVSPASVLLS